MHCLTNVPRISGREWVPTCPFHQLNLGISFQIPLGHFLFHFRSESTIPDEMQCGFFFKLLTFYTHISKITLNYFNGPMINPSYLAGSFLCLADFLWASGGEWVPARPSSPSESLSADLYESECDCLSIS